MQESTARKRKKHKRSDWKLTAMALPMVLFTFLMKYVPMFGWGIAFTNYRPGKRLETLEFVGLKYFKLIAYYWDDISHALCNTLGLSLLQFSTVVLPMIFAVCISEFRHSRLKKITQSLVTIPNFIGWVIVYSMMFSLFSTNGLINTQLLKAGLIDTPTNLLGNADMSWGLMTILDIWKGMGWGSIIYLASISGIDDSLYEAAKIDGAGRLARVIHITVPGLLPVLVVQMVLSIGNILTNNFEKLLLFSNSLTMDKLEVLDIFTYRVGMLTQDYAFATAVGILRSIASITLVLVTNAIAKKVRGEAVI